MIWQSSHRFDPRACALADRHYSRKKPGSPQFMPPGRCFVLYAKTETGEAVWGTSYPFAQYVKHAWAGAWICSIFRNEGAGLSSNLIREAVALTKGFFGDPPPQGMITFIDTKKIENKKNPGYCYKCAGFNLVGMTKGGLLTLQMLPKEMPEILFLSNYEQTSLF